jgi:type VI secretion system secreted protein Hcp
MAFDIFLDFPNPPSTSSGDIKVVGESTDKAHLNAIPVTSVSFGVENSTSIGSATGGAGAGKARFDALEITKNVDASTPYLFNLVGLGAHFPDAELSIRKSGASSDYLIYRFKMVCVQQIKWSGGNGDDAPQETVSLAFGSMQVNYTPTSANGKPAKSISQSWNQVTNSSMLDMPAP